MPGFGSPRLITEEFNVLDFGAVPDGVTDSTPALNAAVAAAAAYNPASGYAIAGKVVLPNGAYLISSTIVVPPNICVEASGGQAVLTGSVNPLMSVTMNADDAQILNRPMIVGIGFYPTGSTNQGLVISDIYNPTPKAAPILRDLTFFTITSSGALATFIGGSNWEIDNCIWIDLNSSGTALVLQGCSGFAFQHCQWYNCAVAIAQKTFATSGPGANEGSQGNTWVACQGVGNTVMIQSAGADSCSFIGGLIDICQALFASTNDQNWLIEGNYLGCKQAQTAFSFTSSSGNALIGSGHHIVNNTVYLDLNYTASVPLFSFSGTSSTYAMDACVVSHNRVEGTAGSIGVDTLLYTNYATNLKWAFNTIRGNLPNTAYWAPSNNVPGLENDVSDATSFYANLLTAGAVTAQTTSGSEAAFLAASTANADSKFVSGFLVSLPVTTMTAGSVADFYLYSPFLNGRGDRVRFNPSFGSGGLLVQSLDDESVYAGSDGHGPVARQLHIRLYAALAVTAGTQLGWLRIGA